MAILLLTTVEAAEPLEELERGAVALLEKSGFKWTAIYDRTATTKLDIMDNIVGWTSQGGPTLAIASRSLLLPQARARQSDQPLRIAYDHNWRCIIEIDQRWMAPYESLSLFGFEPLNELHGPKIIWALNPRQVLPVLLRYVSSVRWEKRALVADLTPSAVGALLDANVLTPGYETPPSARKRMRYVDCEGSVTFWVVDGVLVRYDVAVKALATTMILRIPLDINSTTVCDEIGTAVVDLPAEARTRLGLL